MEVLNDAEYLTTAQMYADVFSTCAKVAVGSLLVTEDNQFMFGTNRGVGNCKKCGCRRIRLYGNASKEHRLPSDCDAVHSEVDAICRAAQANMCTDGATIYVTRYPCEACARAIASSGIKRVVYGRTESISEYTEQILSRRNVQVEKIDWNWEDNNE